jgi:hypothetical protein
MKKPIVVADKQISAPWSKTHSVLLQSAADAEALAIPSSLAVMTRNNHQRTFESRIPRTSADSAVIADRERWQFDRVAQTLQDRFFNFKSLVPNGFRNANYTSEVGEKELVR